MEPVNLVTRVELVDLVTRAVQVNHTDPVEQESRGNSQICRPGWS